MSFNIRSSMITSLFIAVILISLLSPQTLLSQNITLTVGDATGEVGDSLIPLDVRITNLSDSIAGFEFWLMLDRPDIIKFQEGIVIVHDTTYWHCNQFSGPDCIDSTLVLSNGDWDFFHVEISALTRYLYDEESFIMPSWNTYTASLGGFGHDLKVFSIVNPQDMNYIAPPQNDELIIRLYLEVADSFVITPEDSVVQIMWQTDFLSQCSFATPAGETIGLMYEYYPDTNCFVCTQWSGDTCLNYIQVPMPNDCDSMEIIEDSMAVLDPSYWQFNNGSFTLLPTCGYDQDSYDISDLVALVSFMFQGGHELSIGEADCNCDCEINIADLICFVDYMFNGGADPGCDTQ